MNKYSNMLDFTGKVVVVTGGLSGAGLRISEVFAEAGATLIITYKSSAAASESFALKHPTCDAHFFRLDQSDPESVEDFACEVARFQIACLVNNAGIYPSKDILELGCGDWDIMMDTNARGPFLLAQALRPYMADGSSIVNISSLNATNPARAIAHYGVSKAAVEMLTKVQAQAFGPSIRVNCIAPGLIYKEGQDEFIPGWSESYRERSPLHRLVEAADLGTTCLYLASVLAAAVTGEVLAVDCGIRLAPCFYNEVH